MQQKIHKLFKQKVPSKKTIKINLHEIAYTSGLMITAFTGIGLLWLAAKRNK